MQEWDLMAVSAPAGTRDPLVVVEDDGARAVLLVLHAGQVLREHQVRENAWVVVIDGTVTCEAAQTEQRVDLHRGSLARWEPGERRTLSSSEGARMLLILTPWPGPGHYAKSERPSSRDDETTGQ